LLLRFFIARAEQPNRRTERWNPFGEILRLRDAVKRLFEERIVSPSLTNTL
jgi:hypothetical protein